jgi:tRNA threonylcarbamoyl adenosine modification protein (Sua5/YciO/YrdC/YwlC family)
VSAPDPIVEAAAAALRGDAIVLPTDTVYGIGTRPDDPAATARLFEAKRRPEHLELPVLVATPAEARGLAVLDERADRLSSACWPGPLTIVVRRTERSAGWDLGGDPSTIGLRIPHHPLALAVLARTGPLAVTSANRSGEPPARTCDELHAAFGDAVAVYLCADAPLEGAASTVLDLAHGDARILRHGAVDAATLVGLLPQAALLDSPTSR